MNEGHQPLPDREDQRGCVQRYEAMLHRNDRLFFDVEEFELIIDHYLEQNDTRQAKEVLDLAQEQHPGSLDIMFSEAIVLMNMGRLNKALEVLDAIGKLEPYNEEVHLHKASIYSQLRNYRRAIEHYKRALELAEEGTDDILLDLAFEYENIEAWKQAVDCLKRGLEINDENEGAVRAGVCDGRDGRAPAGGSLLQAFHQRTPVQFRGLVQPGQRALAHGAL